MVVNSASFLLFFIIVFLVYYYFSTNNKIQNLWLFASSLFFYFYTEEKMLLLLMIAILFYYFLGIAIGLYNKTREKFSSWLTNIGVLSGIGLLFYFKYLNFFIDSFSNILSNIGLSTNWSSFTIIMPLGISFFTFKLISYIVEIHRGHIEPCRDFISFGLYISFFPTILSGPIDRPKQFITQLNNNRTFNYPIVVDGCRQILWGMLKKMIVADNLAGTVNYIWNDYTNQSSLMLIICAFMYAIQLYMDFSGYSDMAIGVSKILGLNVAKNFNYPFFAQNVADYWRRWHMSLTSWLTDYIFIPLNTKFRYWGNLGLILAIIINLVAVGIWHGANLTYALFGLYHGILFIPLIITGEFQKRKKAKLTGRIPSLKMLFNILLTFCLVSIGLIIFRAENVSQAFDFIKCIVINDSYFTLCDIDIPNKKIYFLTALIIFILEWFAFLSKKEFAFPIIYKSIFKYSFIRILYYAIIFIFIVLFSTEHNQFVYFQF